MKLRILRGGHRVLLGWALNPKAGALIRDRIGEDAGVVEKALQRWKQRLEPQPKERLEPQKREEGGRARLGAIRRSPVLVTPRVQTSEPQNYERINIFFKSF